MDYDGDIPSRGRYPFPNTNNNNNDNKYYDPRFKRVLWFIFASTRGGATRAKILSLINEMPSNPNQIATTLHLNYKTVIHHLDILIKSGLIITDDKTAYGSTYFLTPLMEQNFVMLKEILDKIKIN